MQQAFQTERLDVYKTTCQREGGYTSTDVYMGFHREGKSVYPCFFNVVCCTVDTKCVAWIETVHGGGRGYATELLNGIVEHEKLSEPLYPDKAISERAEKLFKRHEAWFAEAKGEASFHPRQRK